MQSSDGHFHFYQKENLILLSSSLSLSRTGFFSVEMAITPDPDPLREKCLPLSNSCSIVVSARRLYINRVFVAMASSVVPPHSRAVPRTGTAAVRGRGLISAPPPFGRVSRVG